jgi:hypothetical protein
LSHIAGIVTLAVAGTVAADVPANWPRFRGSGSGVVADDPALPLTWSTTQNVAWTLDVPGIGWGSPVVWGDHVFVTSAVNSGPFEPPKPGLYLGVSTPSTAPHRWMVYDVDFASGRIRWAKEVQAVTAAADQARQEQLRLGERRSPTANTCSSTSATSACSRSTSPATWSGRRKSSG